MNYYVDQNEACKKQRNEYVLNNKSFIYFILNYIFFYSYLYFFSSFEKPRHTPRILGRRFALTATASKYLDIEISVGLVSHMEIILGDNRGNQIILPHPTWTTFIERREAVQRFLQSNIAVMLSIRELVIERVKMYDTDIVKLRLHDTCMYMQPQTLMFLFEIETCVEHVYFSLSQNVHDVSEKYKQFVNTIKHNCIIDKCDAIKVLHKVSDKNSLIDCELLAFAMDNILYDALT